MQQRRFQTNCPRFASFVQKSVEEKKAIQAYFELNEKSDTKREAFRFVKPI